MLNMQGISSEARVGKVLVLVAIILGILVILVLAAIAAVVATAGSLAGMGVIFSIPLIFLAPLLVLKLAGVVLGLLALHATGQNDFNRAGILAVIASVLPPLDLVMLIGGIFCLVSREANETRSPVAQPPVA